MVTTPLYRKIFGKRVVTDIERREYDRLQLVALEGLAKAVANGDPYQLYNGFEVLTIPRKTIARSQSHRRKLERERVNSKVNQCSLKS